MNKKVNPKPEKTERELLRLILAELRKANRLLDRLVDTKERKDTV